MPPAGQDDRDGDLDGDLDGAWRLFTLMGSSWMAQALRVAAELGIADHLAAGPRRSAELALATDTHAPSLHRLLRALVSIDVCRELEDGAFELTPMGARLRRDADGSLRAWSIYWGGDLWPVWGRLLESVQTGKSGRLLESGVEEFEHLASDPERADRFNLAMVGLTRLAARSVVRSYDFAAMRRVVDVGGGYGELLVAILGAVPHMRGVLFDLPHVTAAARPHLERAGVADRCELVAGSFFESVPAGADAYVLKSVLHDWDDERAHQILQTCRAATDADATLLVVERVMPERMEPSPAHQNLARTDLTMLVALNARERTEAELRTLLASAGFDHTRTVVAGLGFSIIEARPV